MTMNVDPNEGEAGMASISERENREIEAANASGNTPVVFIHGLWVLPSSWANWVDLFKMPNRGHALAIDHGWREVAETALDFVKRSLRGDGVLAVSSVRTDAA
jgi:hypothetical protein